MAPATTPTLDEQRESAIRRAHIDAAVPMALFDLLRNEGVDDIDPNVLRDAGVQLTDHLKHIFETL